MAPTLRDDPRIDPRLRNAFGGFEAPAIPDIPSRDLLLQSIAGAREGKGGLSFLPDDRAADYARIAPADGLDFRTLSLRSQPDNNEILLHLTLPQASTSPLACVFYIHGGGMMVLSCFDQNYQAWARLVAANGVAVAMVEFRNALRPSRVREVAPFPAGLNDCLSAFRWLRAEASGLGIDPARLVIAGESGGANLAVATVLSLSRADELDGVAGLSVSCPYLAGDWPATPDSSAGRNRGVLMDVSSNFGRVAYGNEAFERRDPLAWPGFATAGELAGFPPTMIAVNECDPLRDDGIAFYRRLLEAGVSARCRELMGTVHGTEIYVLPCPDISRDAARELARFARDGG